MNAIRHCLSMTLGVVALGLVLVAIGVPGATVFSLAPVAICLTMVLLMARGDHAHDGSRRHDASPDTTNDLRRDTPGEYDSVTPKIIG